MHFTGCFAGFVSPYIQDAATFGLQSCNVYKELQQSFLYTPEHFELFWALMTGAIKLKIIILAMMSVQFTALLVCSLSFTFPAPHFTACTFHCSPLYCLRSSQLCLQSSPSLPSDLSHAHCEKANPCSSEIGEYVVRNVCPSWHYNALYQLTRGVGGERRGREEDVKMLGFGAWEEKKKWALCGLLSDRIWSNSMALAFGKIASFNGHSLREASSDMRPHMCA